MNKSKKSKTQRPILEIVPPSPWIEKIINGVEYRVHKPSRKGGIHIRGLAKLCGINISTLQNAIRQGRKVGTKVTENYQTELSNLLKNKTIFLEELTEILPKRRGGSRKIICSDICADLISYYAMKGKIEAVKSLSTLVKFGIEQFIFIQVGFIPRPESIMLNNIEFLIAKETVQVNKSRQEEARFFTNPITGECGIALQSLSFLCGGVAIKHIETFLQAHNEPFLEPQQPEKIVKASLCAAVLQYFGYDNKPRKTLAQHWLQTLEPLVPTLHKKTNYQAPLPTDSESQWQQRAEALELENIQLRQLVKKNELTGKIYWHKFMGQLLEKTLLNTFWELHSEFETTKTRQFLDVLILKSPNQLPPETLLPDGLRFDVEIGLLTYKSHHESLTAWTIQELFSHYVNYRKSLIQDDGLPDAARSYSSLIDNVRTGQQKL